MSGSSVEKKHNTEKSWDDILKSGSYSITDPDPWVIDTLKKLRDKSHGPYMDMGCGLGRHLEPFLNFPGISLGLDCAYSAIDGTRKRTDPFSTVIQASMTDMPFKDKTFGTILAWRSIYLLQNRQIDSAINEVHRVLRDRGHFLCSIRSTTNTLYYVGRELGDEIEPGTFKYPDEEFKGAIYHFFSREEILERFSMFEIHDLHNRELAHTAFTINRPEYKNNFWVFRAIKK